MSNKPTVGNAVPLIETTITKAIIEGFSEKLLNHLQVDKKYSGLPCPFSVMDGIKIEDLPEFHSCGAKHFAAVTAFTQADDPAEEIRRWRSASTK